MQGAVTPPGQDARQYPGRPVVGVGVVVWRGASFLLVRRGREPNKGQWSIPGGAQQLGETVYAAGEREVLEETGLRVDIRGLVDMAENDCILLFFQLPDLSRDIIGHLVPSFCGTGILPVIP